MQRLLWRGKYNQFTVISIWFPVLFSIKSSEIILGARRRRSAATRRVAALAPVRGRVRRHRAAPLAVPEQAAATRDRPSLHLLGLSRCKYSSFPNIKKQELIIHLIKTNFGTDLLVDAGVFEDEVIKWIKLEVDHHCHSHCLIHESASRRTRGALA